MAFSVVTYVYDPEPNEFADGIRPTHHVFFSDLRDKGPNAASSPLGGDTPEALLIIEVETLDEVKVLPDEDPFKKEKVVSRHVVRPWNPTISRL